MKSQAMLAVAALLLCGWVALPAMAQQTASEKADLARYQQFAQAPVDHVTYFQVNGFQYLAPNTVAVWFGVNKLYLLTVQTPCNNLAFTNGISLSAKNNVLYSGFDFVTFRNQQCKILKITPVDELKMKQAAAREKATQKPASSG